MVRRKYPYHFLPRSETHPFWYEVPIYSSDSVWGNKRAILSLPPFAAQNGGSATGAHYAF